MKSRKQAELLCGNREKRFGLFDFSKAVRAFRRRCYFPAPKITGSRKAPMPMVAIMKAMTTTEAMPTVA